MKTSITAGLNEQDKSELIAEFKHCYRLRAQLTGMLEKEITKIHNSMSDLENFEVSNWPLLQASKIAEVNARKKLISLLAN